MKNSKMKHFLFLLLMSALMITTSAMVVLADDETTYVAQIGDVKYETLGEAVVAANSGDTITLLANCDSTGMSLSKNITFEGDYTITFSDSGISLKGSALTFKDCTVVMNQIGKNSDNTWITIGVAGGSSLNLENATLTMNGSGTASDTHAIYFSGNNEFNITKGSSVVIENYPQDALEWDGGDANGYHLNVIDSTVTLDGNRSGIAGTFYSTIDNSKFSIVNSRGNGTNGSHFVIKNGSVVDVSGNGSHGFSVGNISVENSTLTANNNNLNGIYIAGKGTFSNADVTVTGTKGSSYWNAGIRVNGSGTLSIDSESTVTISENDTHGIFLNNGTKLDIDEGADVTITKNMALKSKKENLAMSGGGIVVRNGATATLSESTKIYNNNAAVAGDDIYVEENGTITFGTVASGVSLDGTEGTNDCYEAIDGWYDDAADSRWTNHDLDSQHVELVSAGTYTGVFAAKAAHGALSKNEYTETTLKFTKTDSKSGKALEGAEFTLYEDKGLTKVIGTATSDSDGQVAFEGLSTENGGIYYLKETKAPEGYALSSKVYTITITATSSTEKQLIDGEVTEVTTYTPNSVDGIEGATITNDPNGSDAGDDDTDVRTGDMNNVTLWAVLMFSSLAAVAVIIRRRKAN